ncbi:MAG: hypothetical protein RBT63_00010 [Bdellovibrionales bacterium]|jgi:hypothetical protein|nr:hypothetical protein [Bdellovibrionales bacterium]
MKRAALLVSGILLTLSFQNCGEPFAVLELVSLGDESSVNAPILRGVEYPKISFVPQPCVAGGVCEVRLVSDRVLTESVTGHWRTNDLAWESRPALYAQPNIHYVPAEGFFEMAAGTTSTTLKVNSINWENRSNSIITFSIPLVISECGLGGKGTACSPFF